MIYITQIKLMKAMVFVSIFATAIALMLLPIQKVNALSSSDFNPSRIIDDYMFTDKSDMSVQEIQDFLNTKVSVCDNSQPGYVGESGSTYHSPFTCLKDFYENPDWSYNINYSYKDTGGVTKIGTRSYYYNNAYTYSTLCPVYTGYNPSNFTCNSGDYTRGVDHLIADIGSNAGVRPTGSISAAQIIYDASQAYSINPKVLLVLLQKEQGLVTDSFPAPWQYQRAAGYGCPDTAPCSDNYAGFSKQVYSAAWQFRQYLNYPNNYNYLIGINFIRYNPNIGCGGSNINIQNLATAALYDYTPYQPNNSALTGMTSVYPGGGDACSAYGNRNFFWYFTTWFGTTYSFLNDGLNFDSVFDPSYYATNNPDVVSTIGSNPLVLFNHFIQYGMSEGRPASASFNVINYKNRYPDLRWSPGFGTNLKAYYMHYLKYGKNEGRVGNDPTTHYLSVLNGIDYSPVYDFTTYESLNPDLRDIYGNNDMALLQHFIQYGMSEGRPASASFNVINYKNRYPDLQSIFKDNLPLYYQHYLEYGIHEGRIGS